MFKHRQGERFTLKVAKRNKSKITFDEYYQEIYGSRWWDLKSALLDSSEKVSLVRSSDLQNFSSRSEYKLRWQKNELSVLEEVNPSEEYYRLDFASVLAVCALDPEPGAKVLDLCAAPGGKSLAAMHLMNFQGEWVLNELSQPRLSRLKTVIREFSHCETSEIFFYKRDASRWGLAEKDSYDYVICDVPCSGEAHLLQSARELLDWSPSRSKRLAVRQWAILCAGLEALRSGGHLLYSTCSVNPLENDEVVRRLYKKRSGQFEIEFLQPESSIPATPTELGYNIFPDEFAMGPIYFSLIRKL